MLDPLKTRMIEPMLDVGLGAGGEVVEAENLPSLLK
jgi:hypothetical protein